MVFQVDDLQFRAALGLTAKDEEHKGMNFIT